MFELVRALEKLSYRPHKVACVISASDGEILAVGVNLNGGMFGHAEFQAIQKVDKNRQPDIHSAAITCAPCMDCAKHLVGSGVTLVQYIRDRISEKWEESQKAGVQYLLDNGVTVERLRPL